LALMAKTEFFLGWYSITCLAYVYLLHVHIPTHSLHFRYFPKIPWPFLSSPGAKSGDICMPFIFIFRGPLSLVPVYSLKMSVYAKHLTIPFGAGFSVLL
jgi:hypothetical protein